MWIPEHCGYEKVNSITHEKQNQDTCMNNFSMYVM